MDTYLPSTSSKILEIGAQNVNGTLRDHAPRNAEYIGLDFEAGDGVDIVVTGLDDWSVPDDHFDMVMASSVFEHDKAFWRTFLMMCAKTSPGGHIYISAPSNGTVHRYPQDYWRFYPDAGLALEDWARNEGFDVMLVESFVAERKADVWNDFCAVFRRGPSDADLNRDFVFKKVAATNILTWRSSEIFNPTDDSEDTRLLTAAHEEKHRWVLHSQHLEARHKDELEHQVQEITRLNEEIGRHRGSLALLDEKAAVKDRELVALRQRSEELTRELEQMNAETQDHERSLQAQANATSELQSRLAQREEEAVQAWATAQERKEERDRLATEVEKVRQDLADANQWVCKLALNRTQNERQIARLERALTANSRDLARRHNALAREHEVAMEQGRALSDQVSLLESRNVDLQRRLDTLSASSKQVLVSSLPVKPNGTNDLPEAQELLERSGRAARQAEAQLKEHREEIAALSRMVAQEQDNAVELERRNAWLQAAASFLLEQGKWWWRYMPLNWQRHMRDRRLLRRDLFDSDAYLARNPDVAASGQDPLRHFIHHGITENRRFD
ncbi:methyltransferase domain-containing protein [Novosphingobium pentaromativorans]|uniref:Methyltransferase type 11 domain-containing protein n=1 Tax=Novosphingobium pentaromativorans US6-1 TaxID=1088721 RepID=G6EKF3_9SPHN|nr:hypothetical protein [Novosphingobium pentaromativorans]EHJ58187.1 hypothetical protein NSU_4824 [Novosphingobium pentaromativorans US6-1]